MESATQIRSQDPDYDIILLGRTGVGKSASGNTLLGERAFISKRSVKAVTGEVQKERMTVDGVTLDVYDTPGLPGPGTQTDNYIKEMKNLLRHTTLPVILLVMKADGVSPEDEEFVDVIEDVIPECLVQNIWILFTRGDDLERENLSIEEFIEDTAELKEIVKRFGNRYHVFNNFSESPEQVRTLIHQIRKTAQAFSPSTRVPQTPPPDPRKIVLLGKTGVGKSATGNSILGETRFRSESSSSTVTSEIETHDAVISGRKISVVDTPGLFELSHIQLAEQIRRSIYLSRPGPHAFLYVQPVNVRFTEQEEDVLQKLELIFGKNLHKHTIIVFTFGDLLKDKSVEELIQENRSLRELVKQCGGRYHLMTNNQRKKQQVTDFLEKIDRMVQENGGNHYTSQMFVKAQWIKTIKELMKCVFLIAGVWGGGATIGRAIGGHVGAVCGSVIGAGLVTIIGAASATVRRNLAIVLNNQQEDQSAAHSGDEEDSAPNTADAKYLPSHSKKCS